MKRIKNLVLCFLLSILLLPSIVSAYDIPYVESNTENTNFKTEYFARYSDYSFDIPGEEIKFEDVSYEANSNNSASIIGNIINNNDMVVSIELKITYYDSYKTELLSFTESETIESNSKSFRYTIPSEDEDTISVYDIRYFDIEILEINYNDNGEYSEIIKETNTPSENYTKYKAPYVIDNYDVKIKVNENNSLDITETIDVYYHESRHGIMRNIPITNTVRRLDGTSTKNRVIITDISVNETYSKYFQDSNLVLKIGSEISTVLGKKSYVIKYNYDLGKDPLDDIDEFYFNIIGDQWDTYIGNITFSIEMPKEFDSEKLGFSHGEYGSTTSDNVEYEVNGNIITGTYNGVLNPNNGLTVRLELPDKYFVHNFNFDIFTLIIWIIPIILILIGYNLWRKYGDDDPVIETVEFYPPDNLNSLDLAYEYYGSSTDRRVISLLIYLANKGYIKIEEFEKKSMYNSAKSFKIRKLKEYDGNNYNEQLFLEGLFKKKPEPSNDLGPVLNSFKEVELEEKDVVYEKDLVNNFYSTIIKIHRNCDSKENRDRLFEKNGKYMKQVFLLIIICYLSIFVLPAIEYNIFGEVLNIIFLFLVFMPFLLVVLIIKAKLWVRLLIFLMLASPLLSSLISNPLFTIIINDYKYLVSAILNFSAFIILSVILGYIPKRTAYGNKMLGRISGFKKFLELVEKEQLEALVLKDPTYFYNILPYTYALGISEKWIEKFESIALKEPEWYSGTDSFSNTSFSSFMDTTMSRAASSMSSRPASSSSGGSSSGGSSGGGSSGGGSGGGGGSSW